MNLGALVFTFLTYGTFLALYNGAGLEDSIFPTFDAPTVDFEEIPDSCSGFTDCIEYVGKVLVNFVLGIVYVVLLIVEIITLVVSLLTLAATNAFQGAEGAPVWLNGLILSFFGITTAIVIYRAIRKGDTETA